MVLVSGFQVEQLPGCRGVFHRLGSPRNGPQLGDRGVQDLLDQRLGQQVQMFTLSCTQLGQSP